ncbi:sugar ABC transporter ATP-binding protein [Pandoraea apista]|uniref:sugar ABC transporter ATP-binding protein n=1 Tax=Pandoraea apista TaxID=93218 RepID=UPI00248DEC60|nr:sugar ABC transporter ATP-binding protein [Pandoraea apista]
MITKDRPGALLDARGLAKSFGATQALRHADLRVQPGEVHALMGENGAGKSTLVKMLVGALKPDAGEIVLQGRRCEFHSVRDAIAMGVVPVYQHATVFPELSVEENLRAFDIARAQPFGRRAASAHRDDLLGVAHRIGLHVDARQPVASLSMAERQLLEIARGVASQCRVLILDEPTAALNEHETERLFTAVASLKAEGLGIVFISHKLGEITRICDAVTVLRDGATVIDAAPIGTLSHRQIVEGMVGPVAEREHREPGPVGAPRLIVRQAACQSRFSDLSLSIGAGEVVGIVGLIGAGAIEVGEALAGARALSHGSISVDGHALGGASRMQFMQHGVGFVPADRSAEGILPGLSCATNAAASTFASIARARLLTARMERQASASWFEALRVKPADVSLPIDALSGGNQQKVMLIRNLMLPGLSVLVVIEPTRGVDVHARAAIHDVLIDASRRGIAIVIASTDTDEVVALAHRIVVMRAGRPAGELPRGTPLEEVIARIADASPITLTHTTEKEANHAAV